MAQMGVAAGCQAERAASLCAQTQPRPPPPPAQPGLPVRAQGVQDQDDPAQHVAGHVGGAQGSAQLPGSLFPSRHLNGEREASERCWEGPGCGRRQQPLLRARGARTSPVLSGGPHSRPQQPLPPTRRLLQKQRDLQASAGPSSRRCVGEGAGEEPLRTDEGPPKEAGPAPAGPPPTQG